MLGNYNLHVICEGGCEGDHHMINRHLPRASEESTGQSYQPGSRAGEGGGNEVLGEVLECPRVFIIASASMGLEVHGSAPMIK